MESGMTEQDLLLLYRLKFSAVRIPFNVKLFRIRKYAAQVSVLTQHFNALYGTFMLNTEFIVIVGIVINATFAVLRGSPRSVVIAFSGFVLVIYGYKIFGTMYEESRVTLEG